MHSDGYDFMFDVSVMFRASGDWGHGREPVLRRMPDGSLVCLVYSGGPSEPHDDNVVLIVRSTDNGASWSQPEVLFRHATRGVWATEIFTDSPQPLAFVHTFDAASHYLELNTFLSCTADSGRTWSEPVSLPAAFHSVAVRQGLTLRNGAWLFPIYWQEARASWDWRKTSKAYSPHDSWRFASGVMLTLDGGQSWSTHGRLTTELNLWEPNVVEIAPEKLVMLMRAEGAAVKYRADSSDGGRTWSTPHPTDIPDANSKITLLQHEDAILMLHNPSAQPGWLNRNSLELWVSHDGCQTWPMKMVLARSLNRNQVICYPHGFVDTQRGLLCVGLDAVHTHYYMAMPLSEVLGSLGPQVTRTGPR